MRCLVFLFVCLCSATFSGLWETPNTAFYLGLQAEYTERFFFQIGNQTLEYSLQAQSVVGIENISALWSYSFPNSCSPGNWCRTAWEKGFDAVWRWRSKTYFFLGDYYARPSPENTFSSPNTISGGWPGVGGFLDAAAESDATTSDWAFRGDQTWLYSVPGDKTILQKPINEVYPGIPTNLSSAMRDFHMGYMLFFKDGSYWAFDAANARVLPGFPRNIFTPTDRCAPATDLSSLIGFVQDKVRTGLYLPNLQCWWNIYVPQLYYTGVYGEYDDLSQFESSSANYIGIELRFTRFNLNEGDSVHIYAHNDIHAPASNPYSTENKTLMWTFNSTNAPQLSYVFFISNASKSWSVHFVTGARSAEPQANKGDGFRLEHWLRNSVAPFRSLIAPVWLTSSKTSTPTTVLVQPATQTNSIIDFRIYIHLLPDDVDVRPQVMVLVYDGTSASGNNLVANCSAQHHSPSSCLYNTNTDRCPCLATTRSGAATLVLVAPAGVLAAANSRYSVRSTCHGYQAFSDISGTITDGSGDLVYFPNQRCHWYINHTQDNDALIVVLTFTSFWIQDLASVSIWASNDTSPVTRASTFSGQLSTPFEVITEVPQMSVVFESTPTTGAVAQFPGFSGTYNVVYIPDPQYSSLNGLEQLYAATKDRSQADLVCDVGTQLSLTINALDKFQRQIATKYWHPTRFHMLVRAIPTSIPGPLRETVSLFPRIINATSPTAQQDANSLGLSMDQFRSILDYPAYQGQISFPLPTTPGTYYLYLILIFRNKVTYFHPLPQKTYIRVQLVASAPVPSACSILNCKEFHDPDFLRTFFGLSGNNLPTLGEVVTPGTALNGSAGDANDFCIIVRDKYGNQLGRGSSDVRVFVISSSYAIPVHSMDIQNGIYLAKVDPSYAATYAMTVLVGGSDIPGSPFGFYVSPGPTDPERTSIQINGITVIDSGRVRYNSLNLHPGVPFNITLRTMDSQGNPRNFKGDAISINIPSRFRSDITAITWPETSIPWPTPPDDRVAGIVGGAVYSYTVVVYDPGDLSLFITVNNRRVISRSSSSRGILPLIIGYSLSVRSSWHNILGILAIIFNSIICFVSVVLVYIRRHKVPLKHMSPTLLILNTFGCLTFIHFALVEILDSGFPCVLYFRGSLVAPILWMTPLLLSIYRLRLIFPYAAQKRKWAKLPLDANDLASIQTKRLSFSENRFLLYYFIFTVPPVAVILTLGARIGRETGWACVMEASLETAWIVVGCVYSLAFYIALFSVRGFDEKLGFRQEVALLGMYGAAVAVIAIVIRFSQWVTMSMKDDIMFLVSVIPLTYQIRGVLIPALRTIPFFIKATNSEVEIALTDILVTKNGFEWFCAFCGMEFSEENPLCWDAIESFRKRTSIAGLKDVYNKFFLPESPLQVNFPAEIIREVNNLIARVNSETPLAEIQSAFDNAQNEVVSLMTHDSYRRFIASDYYKRFRNGEQPPVREGQTRSDTHPESSADHMELHRTAERKQRNSLAGLFETTERDASRRESKTVSSRQNDEEEFLPTRFNTTSEVPPLTSEPSTDEAWVI